MDSPRGTPGATYSIGSMKGLHVTLNKLIDNFPRAAGRPATDLAVAARRRLSAG
ncbi:hypothetical protein BaRGS_00015235, partial [Batillaria attramentaria]